ncbi:peptide-methionine (S)-S-oxide reductase [Halopelagius inordinatus]|uniref:Peptide methionine sulfoxide reductase MsrA n=1 Tax=Halopelagius inordinatus TaxID=553467 RepID=A0A1I2U6B6_9EURY|nr:peptide-methionine (S)-S-oxide reductase MsrA [Halopelagius inordinatus]SFG71217.1 peptide-methionine (S)-S-oxide reductase [Halopelagius inordinatus]
MAETEIATLAGGCFWCVEAPMKELTGVESVTSGYAGGHVENPSYEEVCSETTGHAEVVQVEFDPETISFRELLDVFFAIHDPTTEDKQGPDVGSQYRSAIFYRDDDQRRTAEETIAELEADGVYDDIVTEVEPLETFYEAEEHHQDYYEKNPNQPYCAVQIPPKLEKVKEKFGDKVRGVQ